MNRKTPGPQHPCYPNVLTFVSKAISGQQLPEFLRLPKSGARCPVTSLSRATLNELILKPDAPVKSVVLRKRGKIRGIRLIVTSSLLDYLHSNVDGRAEETTVNGVNRANNGGVAE